MPLSRLSRMMDLRLSLLTYTSGWKKRVRPPAKATSTPAHPMMMNSGYVAVSVMYVFQNLDERKLPLMATATKATGSERQRSGTSAEDKSAAVSRAQQ